MDHEVQIIHQNPLRASIAFKMMGGQTFFLFEYFSNLIADRLILFLIVPLTDDQEIGKPAYLRHVQYRNLVTLLLIDGLAGLLNCRSDLFHTNDVF